MIDELGRALGKTPVIKQLPEQAGDVKQTHADVTRARDRLGFEPQTTLREGLRRYVEWRRRRT
jgi:UDP-glucuronate 4-epimerase